MGEGNTKITITIPAFEYGGAGAELLNYSFGKMVEQTFKDFDIVVSDSSPDDDVKEMCEKWGDKLDIKYVSSLESKGNPAQNLNIAMRHAKGDWIKILCQDDYLLYTDSMEMLNDAISGLKNGEQWIATAYLHSKTRKSFFNYHAPYLNPQLYIVNTIGTPSCVTIKNNPDILMFFDEELSYCYDCELYYRLFKAHGNPRILTDVTIVNYIWENSITASITKDIISKENKYIIEKHGIGKEQQEEESSDGPKLLEDGEFKIDDVVSELSASPLEKEEEK